MIEPKVWLPRLNGTIPLATTAADPLDEPPGVCKGFQGFTVGPGLRQANSVVTVLPKMMPPNCLIRPIISASLVGWWFT